MTRWSRLAILVLASLALACRATRATDCERFWNEWRERVIAAAATNPPMLVVPGESVGPVKLGMSAAEVRAAIGPPQFGDGSYLTLGLGVSFRDGQVEGISAGGSPCGDPERLLSRAFRGHFGGGVGMGATRQQVVAVLGEPLGPGFVDEEGHEMLTYRGLDLIFENGRLGWLKISRPAG
jgi:hypothetical protein